MAPTAIAPQVDSKSRFEAAKPKNASSTSLKPPVFTDKQEERIYVKERLALAFRIFGKLGYDEGVAGHITVRDPVDPTSFWVNPFGKHFSMIQASDLLLVSHTGKILNESGPSRLLNTAAFMIHSAVHTARPDVLCAAHSHSINGRAFSTLGRPLDITTRDSCAFFDDHVVHTEFKGVVLDEEEGIHIAESLGEKKAAILKNHGLLVATSSIEATVFFFKSLEQVCRVQLLADAAAEGKFPQTIPRDEALRIWEEVGCDEYGYLNGLIEFKAAAYSEARRQT